MQSLRIVAKSLIQSKAGVRFNTIKPIGLNYTPRYNFFYGSNKETKEDQKDNKQKTEEKQEEEKTYENEQKNEQQENLEKDEHLKNQENQVKEETSETVQQTQNEKEEFDKLLKIKQDYEKLQEDVKSMQKQNSTLENDKKSLQKKNRTLDDQFNDQKKKNDTLRDSLKGQIEENELSQKRLTKYLHLFREKEQTKQFAIVNFAKEMLDVQDNLERALESSKDLEGKNDALFEGVKLTKNCLESVFNRNKIVRVYPLDEKFDPNVHDALFQYEDASKEAGTVGNVAFAGYTIYDRVLRPAKVGVIKKSEE